MDKFNNKECNWRKRIDIIKDITEEKLIEDGRLKYGKKASLEIIAEYFGIKRGKIRAWNNGQIPNAEDLEKICEILPINPVWLLTGEGEPTVACQPQSGASLGSSCIQSEGTGEKRTGFLLSGSPCTQCEGLKKALEEERLEWRDLSKENRRLWAEVADLRERTARMENLVTSYGEKGLPGNIVTARPASGVLSGERPDNEKP